MANNDMPFCKINGFPPCSVGAPTHTPSSLTPIDSPLQDDPAGSITASLLYLSAAAILIAKHGVWISYLEWLPPASGDRGPQTKIRWLETAKKRRGHAPQCHRDRHTPKGDATKTTM